MTGPAQTLRKLVTCITEASLERELSREIESLGVRGYTITDVRGRGDQGARSSSWGHTGNIRVEVVCDVPLAEKLLSRLREKYAAHYAMVLWVQDVEVMRADKFN